MTSFVAHCVFLVSDVNRWARNKETKLHAHSWYSLISITAAQIITHSNILCYKWWLHETEHVRSNYLRCHMTMMTSFIPLVGKDLFHFKQKVLLFENKSNTSFFLLFTNIYNIIIPKHMFNLHVCNDDVNSRCDWLCWIFPGWIFQLTHQ